MHFRTRPDRRKGKGYRPRSARPCPGRPGTAGEEGSATTPWRDPMNSIVALRPTAATPSQPPIVVGTRVSTILYNRGEGFVTAIHGEQRPQTVRSLGGGVVMMGGRAEFDIVFLSGSFSRRLPECILRGVQWRLLDCPGSEAEIAAAVAHAEAMERQRAADAAAADAAHETELARLRSAPEHSTLRQGDERHGGKLAAANIRVELRRAFPGVKFSVRVPDHGSVHIRWTNGPTRQEVEAIACRYQGGHFDGMEDIYRSARSAWCEVFGGADYVSCSREGG